MSFFKSRKQIKEEQPQYIHRRYSGRSTGQAFEIIGWCLRHPEETCVITNEQARRLRSRFDGRIPQRYQDHGNYDPHLSLRVGHELNKMLHRTCWYMVKDNKLEGFTFGKKYLTIKFSLEN
jgi:hypothetical protein